MDTAGTTPQPSTARGAPSTTVLDAAELHDRTVAWWLSRVTGIGDGQWDAPTPCTDWTVRDLVGHVVGEERWTAPLMRGATIEEVGDRFDGDLLGDDPRAVARAATTEATQAVAETYRSSATVHLSYGDESMEEYLRQLAADHLVHGWDLAAATGQDRTLDPDLVAAVTAWFTDREELYRSGGAIAARRSLTGDPQTDLLAGYGRDAAWGPNHAGFAGFVAAFGRGDVDAIMALMTDDCVFEATGPAPDGMRHEGAAEVRAVWEGLFTETGSPAFTEEESFVAGDRAVLRWRFDWVSPDGSPGHVRGVDVVRLRDGLVCEKLSYVKG